MMENTDDDDDDHGGGGIPEDVLIQILVWLPVISLLRFKSVSKSWRDLIESCFFIHLHAAATLTTTSSSSNKFGSLILQTSPLCDPTETRIVMLTPGRRRSGGEVFEVEDLGFPPLLCKTDLAWWKIVGSCNGLICTQLRKDVCFWNPATRQFRLLPKSSLTLEEERGWILASDVFGFGFDVKTKDYKVVQIRPMLLHRKLVEFRVQVYSLSTNSWRWLLKEEEGGINSLSAKSSQGSSCSFYMSSDDKLYMNGSFFFKETYVTGNGMSPWVLSFDFTNEIFTLMKQFPKELVDSKSTFILTYFGADKIAFLVESSSSSLSSREGEADFVGYDIWVLNNNEYDHDQEKQEKEEKGSYYWTKLQHTIRISSSYCGWIYPKVISDDGEFALIEARGKVSEDLKLHLFNLVTKPVFTKEEKPVFVFPTGMELLRAQIYKPTLVSVIGSGGGNGNGTAGSSSSW